MHGCYSLAVAVWKVKSKKELSVGSVVLFLLSEERFVTSGEDMVIGEREQPGTMVSSLHKEQQNNVVIEWTNLLEHGNKTDIWGVVLLVPRKKIVTSCCREGAEIGQNALVLVLPSQVCDNQTGKYGRVLATPQRKVDVPPKGRGEVFCEMVTVSAVTRIPFCAIPSDACAAFLRHCLSHNHL